MTRYLDVKAVSDLVQSVGLEKILTDMAGYILDDYRRWDEFTKSPRTVNHSPLGVNELMPIADKNLYTFKYVNGHPANTAKNLSTVIAFGMLADVETGYPQLLSEMTLITALRTAATSAIVARFLARENSQSMAVIGCGGQSEFQIIAFHALLGIRHFHVFDIDADAMNKLRDNLSGLKDIEITLASSSHDAVKGVDIVTTVTADKTRATILTPDMITPGMHLNAIGGDCPGKTELHPDILHNARVVVEYEPQTRIEGDIQQLPVDFLVTEFWKIATGIEAGRKDDEQITVFDGVGFALEDFSALRYFNDLAIQQNAGTTLDLVPTLANPKNLYSLLHPVTLPVTPRLKTGAWVEESHEGKK